MIEEMLFILNTIQVCICILLWILKSKQSGNVGNISKSVSFIILDTIIILENIVVENNYRFKKKNLYIYCK